MSQILVASLTAYLFYAVGIFLELYGRELFWGLVKTIALIHGAFLASSPAIAAVVGFRASAT